MLNSQDNSLATYLKDRRAKLDPSLFGFSSKRRRTPGLRREEVAQRAHVSATWYTWLEQGRGGTPSSEVLDGIATALALTSAEREHLFLLAQRRPPQVHYQTPEPVTPQLQRVLDSLEFSPALVKTASWDVVAWNHAATMVLTDYAALAPRQRNILRLLFGNPRIKTEMANWESYARFAVAVFRANTTRAGASDSESVTALIDELRRLSPEFEAIWRDHDVQTYGEGTKLFHHPTVGSVSLEYSSFAVDGRPDLGLIIFTPATPMDTDRIKLILAPQT